MREVVIEPAGERRVHVHDRAVRLRREEAGGRVVQIVDRVLEILEKGLVLVVLTRFVGDAPERRSGVSAIKRANPDTIPGHVRRSVGRGREPQFLAGATARFRRLCQPVDRFGNVGRAGEKPLDGFNVGGSERP